MQSVCEGKEFDFPAEELKTLGFWDDTDAFKQVAAERVESCRNTRSFRPTANRAEAEVSGLQGAAAPHKGQEGVRVL